MLDEIRTVVVLAEAGSLRRAAERLFLTPSAVTRQVQRLEAAFGTPLLDRKVKPARLTRAGHAVVDSGRQVLRVVDDLRVSTSNDGEPEGAFRIGIAHAMAQPTLAASIQRMASRFTRLQPIVTTDLTQTVIEQARTGRVDVALAFLPAGAALTSEVTSSVLADERLVVVRARDPKRRSDRADRQLEAPWVLNPQGCLVRQALEVKLRELGVPLSVGAEIHNIELQLSLVAAGIALGMVPARYLAAHPRRRRFEIVRTPGLHLHASVVFIRSAHLGPLDAAATVLEDALREQWLAK